MSIKSRLEDAIWEIECAIDDLPDFDEERSELEEYENKKLILFEYQINSDLLQTEAQHELKTLDDKSYELLKYHLSAYKKTLTI